MGEMMRVHITKEDGNIRYIIDVDNIFRNSGGLRTVVADHIKQALSNGDDVLITKDRNVKTLVVVRKIEGHD
jgi:uncharacterized Zn ribbon protein